jgi:hypothetical protein
MHSTPLRPPLVRKISRDIVSGLAEFIATSVVGIRRRCCPVADTGILLESVPLNFDEDEN